VFIGIGPNLVFNSPLFLRGGATSQFYPNPRMISNINLRKVWRN